MNTHSLATTDIRADPIWIAAGACSAAASILHLACLVVGGPMYRFLGAGEQMAELAESGHWYPPLATVVISTVLAGWAWYAFAAAGILARPPLLRTGLCLVTAIYVLRGLAILPVSIRFAAGAKVFLIAGAGGGLLYWICTSLICLAFGLVHLAGLVTTGRKL